MSWIATSIGALVAGGAASIQTGPFGTQLKASDYVSEGTPVINVRNVGYGDLRAEKLEFVTAATAERLATHLIRPDDIVFGRKGAVDRHLFVGKEQKDWLQGSDCIRLRFLSDSIEPRFVSYAFLSPVHQQWMLSQAGNKATMASLNHDIIERIALYLPARSVQARIVEVVSAYDDLIENNRRRMALLEEAARLLYREWFVRLRFPGHEGVRVVNGVPEGWEWTPIATLAECVGGGTPSTTAASYWDGGNITWVTPTDVTRNDHLVLLDAAKKITALGLKESSAKLVPAHAVLMTSRASVGFFGIMEREVCTNQGFISIVAHDPLFSRYLLFQCSERVDEIRAMGSGATYPEVSRGKFREFKVLVPARRLVEEFDAHAARILMQVRLLKRQTEKLRAARDLLLPRLMSGELEV